MKPPSCVPNHAAQWLGDATVIIVCPTCPTGLLTTALATSSAMTMSSFVSIGTSGRHFDRLHVVTELPWVKASYGEPNQISPKALRTAPPAHLEIFYPSRSTPRRRVHQAVPG